MRAAVVTRFDAPPSYGYFSEPVAGEGEVVIRVLAVPLSPIVKSLAAGRHYSGAAEANFIPGIDGVGIDPDGKRVYFLFPKSPFGSMADQALVSAHSVMPVPESVGDARAAAVVTAGLSSWVALTLRAGFQRGESVLINGATGSAGSLAVQIAAWLGAGRIIATGRNQEKLDQLPAGVEKIVLDDSADEALKQIFSGRVDVVLDYLWGEPASRIIAQATANRGSRLGEPRLRYIQLGSVAGETVSLPAASLRSSGLEILGSGIGSLSVQALVAGAGELLNAIPQGRFTTPVRTCALSDVGKMWNEDTGEERLILIP
ncbi:quinone oxidoreductase family protein [Pantoea agglomerans]|uniref:Zinc-binding alcohol dehydrogenase family protein n=1 Tax=Enterobacter agglomerans TaxID=549 RepID=A0AAN2FCD4_ENTAG|nr:zinc-binding alcohol dehydrogenase family protein [Pantoea agglomerans]CAH6282841.1 Zinc-binding alcohol dehydrogenase family protein [Pantoea agglomerans]